jgi:signal transduction histidine kinase
MNDTDGPTVALLREHGPAVATAIRCAVAVLAAVVLAGWVADAPALVRVVPGSAPMAMSTATCFLLLCLAWIPSAARATGRASAAPRVLAAVLVAAIAGANIASYALGTEALFDRRIAPMLAPAAVARLGVRMSLTSAIVLFAFAVAVFPWPHRRLKVVTSGAAATVAVALGLASLIGHLYSITHLSTLGFEKVIAVASTFSHLLLAAALLLQEPAEGITATALSPHEGGIMVRRLAVVILAGPVALGGLLSLALRSQLISVPQALLGMVVGLTMLFAVVLFWNARSLNRANNARRESEERLLQAQKMEAIGRLAGGVAHDFNNLLTVIGGYTELALTHVDPADPLADELHEIGNAARRAADLTSQLLAFSRKQLRTPVVLDLNAVVMGMESLLRRLLGEDVELRCFLPDGAWRIKADHVQIEQVLMNLAVNARDAMRDGGRLVVETANVHFTGDRLARAEMHPGRYVQLSVSDNGCGMDRETVSRIFEPFFTTKAPGKGTGLGLPTVYGIVKQSGGFVYCYSEPGSGTTFKVYLPRVETEEPQDDRPAVKAPAARGRGERIVVIEDEASVRHFVTEVLARSGYDVTEACNGAEALPILARMQEPALVITDVVMPGVGGREVAAEVGRRFPRARVLYVSGYAENAVARSGILDAGVQLMSKPFSAADLLARVRGLIDS